MESIVKTTGNSPEKKIRAGSISATIWSNTSVKDGKSYTYQTVSFERNYKDKNNEWQTTNSLRANDLPKAILVLSKAYESLSMSESMENEA